MEVEDQEVTFSRGRTMYSYSRTAAKKDKPSRTDGAKPNEVEAAIKAVEKAIDAVHDCAPNGKDFRTDEDYDSKSYQKEAEAHSDRIHALNDIRDQLYKLLPPGKGKKEASYDRTAASTTMKSGMWYYQKTQTFEAWFLAQKEQKNGGYAGKLVRWTTRNPKAINDSVPKSFWSLWKELPESEVPQEVKDAV